MTSDTFSIKFTDTLGHSITKGRELVDTITTGGKDGGVIKSILYNGNLNKFIDKIEERLPMYWAAYTESGIGNERRVEYEILVKLKKGWSSVRSRFGSKTRRVKKDLKTRQHVKLKRSKKKIKKLGWFGI
jgi:hypothetical protein